MRYTSKILGALGAVLISGLVAWAAFDLPSNSGIIGHLRAINDTGKIPTVGGGSCGSPVLTAGSTDFAGEFQAKGTSTCVLTFGTAYASKPFCNVNNSTTPADNVYTYTAAAITMGTTVSNDLITYQCVGKSGG